MSMARCATRPTPTLFSEFKKSFFGGEPDADGYVGPVLRVATVQTPIRHGDGVEGGDVLGVNKQVTDHYIKTKKSIFL